MFVNDVVFSEGQWKEWLGKTRLAKRREAYWKAQFAGDEYLAQLEFADSLGFDGICVNEHHSNAYGLMPSPNLILAALARRTSNASLIVLGNSIAL